MNSRENHNPWVIRTDFSDGTQWVIVCELIAAPQSVMGQEFYARIRYVSDVKYAGLECHNLIRSCPRDCPEFFCFIVGEMTLGNEDYLVLVVGFAPNIDVIAADRWMPKQTALADIKTFRAIPATYRALKITFQLPTWILRLLSTWLVRLAYSVGFYLQRSDTSNLQRNRTQG